MRLNYSTSLVTFTYIHLILVHIIFIPLPAETQAADHEQEDTNYYDIPEQNKKLIIEQVKANLLKVLGLKEAPKRPHNKAFVPLAMLEEYKKARESVRDIIPDDRDYYGKINLDDLDQRHEDFWSGDFGVEVEMGQDKLARSGKQKRFAGEADRITYLAPQSEPEDVPSNLEHLLPPHSRSSYRQKQFISVHLRFNLSQEYYLHPTSADELKGAELILKRERIFDCEFNDCDRKPVPFFTTDESSSEQNDDNTEGPTDSSDSSSISNKGKGRSDDINDNSTSSISGVSTNSSGHNSTRDDSRDSSLKTNKLHNRPRYQRVYVLHITGYDMHNEPIASIHDSQRVDTLQSTQLVFDIYKIIRYWLKNPAKNYGIIVRVTNDDREIKQQVASSTKNLSSPTNASPQNASPIQLAAVEEHVRLKRGFRSASESDETWRTKQPSILLYAQPSEAARHHVKRDHTASDTDDMQADEQVTRATTSEHASNDPVQSNQTNDDTQSKESEAHTSKLSYIPSGTLETSTSQYRPMIGNNVVSRRDSRQTTAANQQIRSISGSRPSATSNGQSPRGRGRGKLARQNEKCNRRSLEINFEEVGWSSWIIAPFQYSANYCAGDCTFPMSDHQNATNHAIIQSIYQAVRTTIPRSCCAPVKLGSLNILYQLDGTVEMRTYNDMIVESCGCL